MSVFRRYRSALVCSRCQGLLAHIDLRAFVRPQLRDSQGRDLAPLGGTTAMGIAQTRLRDAERTDATSLDADQGEGEAVRSAERDIGYLRREAGELT